ncbi:MAG TPA: response regulator transcription factor, partial [Chloroflexi bacterium]|nr:response regulator transcription factor [Chloroflexota bacterium]
MSEAITVVIADDHGVVREGLRSMLEREGLHVVGEAASGREAIALVEAFAPDVVLLDIRMPDLDGLQALAAIKATRPETSVIMLTSYANPGYLARAIANGAAGFLSKEADPDRIPPAVRAAATGEHLLDQELLRVALASAAAEAPPVPEAGVLPPDLLTEAEIRVLRLIAEGLDNQTIADSLNLSVNTVKTHVRHTFEKLHVSDRTQA